MDADVKAALAAVEAERDAAQAELERLRESEEAATAVAEYYRETDLAKEAAIAIRLMRESYQEAERFRARLAAAEAALEAQRGLVEAAREFLDHADRLVAEHTSTCELYMGTGEPCICDGVEATRALSNLLTAMRPVILGAAQEARND